MEIKHENKEVNILVIDDEQSIGDLLKKTLTRFDYYVEAFTDSRDALQRFDAYNFDVVITDLSMPDISGWDVAKHVKKGNPSIPVILVTGEMLDLDEKNLAPRGINFALHKPYSLKKLIEIVKKAHGPSPNR